MKITIEKLQSLWSNRKRLFEDPRNESLINRFDKLNSIFNILLSDTRRVTEENGEVFVGGVVVKLDGHKNPDLSYFGPANDEIAMPKAMLGVYEMKKRLNPEFGQEIENIGRMLCGFDFEKNYMDERFRIISNVIKYPNDKGTLISSGEVRHPSSHLADNNYFFWIYKAAQLMKSNAFNYQESNIVLRYPGRYNFGESEEKEQRKVLEARFPYKFLYMWANKDHLLHPFSLMAYRNMVLQTAVPFSFDTELKMLFDDFKVEWEAYSNNLIAEIIGEENKNKETIAELSKLLSVIMVEDQDTKSILELVQGGNKAIVLYGPPGTGKTYEAKRLAKALLKCDIDMKEEDFEKAYLFPDRIEEIKNDQGYYTIVQFHPNYSYENFIGGIHPKISDDGISYYLKEGIFKKLCDSAALYAMQNYVIIIDEINRADLSSVFGELLYAIEYRGDKVDIPNFGNFIIPDNVYIIGTMNNVDKSLVTFDLALRRRFGFYKLMPNLNALTKMIGSINDEKNSINLSDIEEYIERCKNLNEELSNKVLNLSSEHQIGHAYFGKIVDFIKFDDEIKQDGNGRITIFELEKLWDYHLEPLLEEYLGVSITDDSIYSELKKMKESFTKPMLDATPPING